MKLTGKASLCRSCGEVFSTTRNFEQHRLGGYDIALPDYGRRCLTPAEMTGKGWRQNKAGRWTPNPPRLVQRSDLETTIRATPVGGEG